MVNASVCLATIEYHQQAVDLFSPFNHEWCTYYLNSGENGERKLGVYFSLENTLPHRTISIEKDESQLPKVAALLEELNQSQAGTNARNTKREVQEDLFGYIMDKEKEY
ncbi:hypothetical protein J8Z28_01485 [Pseudoalteromonas sp. SCSIO 43088]|uniref:hypothetical protein n=1 Tax=Pseudoalteromonas sp. SCSIO 43088 TaxID=2822846 RepID=UPI00202B1B63|nr:hypothetical protein [Pseudoalteromonas sp. SCSIO 43088]URQ86613.1 hypothetical protein J8Z28_01485 [Pseudoalteromonas sp. SCSIO 43088]